jgi:serine/threonine-protein kinase
MLLEVAARVGPYEILSALGAGGMGEVYRAHDTKLGRDVAIKILPQAFLADPERVARFQREARTLASLNHPHIGGIYGLEEAAGIAALVLELVEGPTLADRIAQGRISIEEALPIARQIAEALEAAHEQGIIHRDLKPANIKVRLDGTVKVLDFGLAKAMDPAGTAPNASRSPTITTPAMTHAGMIFGTAAYMSPEQAKGRPLDKRTDIWAFGCVLYEMIAGRRAFEGADVSDTLAAVLRGEPDWNALPSNVPLAVRALIQGCLRKDRKGRIGDISTALFVLGQPLEQSGLVSRPRPSPVWRRAMLIAGAVLISAAITATVVWQFRPLPAGPVIRLAFTLPEGHQVSANRGAVAISPDGTRMVYGAEGRLYLRSMSDFEARAIPGTDGAINPVFSPDGQSLVFWFGSALKRIAVGGGMAVTIFQSGAPPSGVTWGNDGIVFSPTTGSAGGIMRVSPSGGKPEVLLDLNNSDDAVFSSQVLPDGRTLLFTIGRRTTAAIDRWDDAQIVVQSIETGVRKTIIEGGSDARYVPTGHIVYVSGGTLLAVPFDLPKLEVTGGAVPVVEGVRRENSSSGVAQFAFSNSGSLIYVPGPASGGQDDVVLFDRRGGAEPLKLPPGRYDFPRVSPDGKRIAFETNDGKEAVVSIFERSGASSVRRLTFGGNNHYPLWSADGLRVTFQSDREGDPAVFWQPVDGGTAERLTTPDRGTSHAPESWSADGQVLLFSATKDFVSSLWTLSLRDRKAMPFGDVKGSSLPTNAMFSPDGRWVAYQIGTTRGGMEGTTYVQPFPPTGTKYEIARGGRPLWSRDGKELFFVPAPSRFMVVTVRMAPSFTVTSPVAVPRGFGVANPMTPRTFDIMPDGRIVGIGTPQSGSGPAQIHVVLNWFEELKRLVPVNQ